MTESTLTGPLRQRFAEIFGAETIPKIAVAPGRVNLVGEHTDYNEGYVLPMAIDRCLAACFTPRRDKVLKVHSMDFAETREFVLPTRTEGASRQPESGSRASWVDYVVGVFLAMQDAGFEVSGINMALQGDIPIGAGLSSSAALEMAVARAVCEAFGISWNCAEMARLGQKVENNYIGVSSGIMDQFAAIASLENCALLLDCRTLKSEPVLIPCDAAIVVMDTGVRRTLSGSAYNDRHAACVRTLNVIRSRHPQVIALRDVDLDMLEQSRDTLDEATFKRAKHVIEENWRPVKMAAMLRAGDLAKAGDLMKESHASLRDLYEVSCKELDRMSEHACRHAACFGARMTGAGFGGCAVALVERQGVKSFMADVQSGYQAEVDAPSVLFECHPSAGARILE